MGDVSATKQRVLSFAMFVLVAVLVLSFRFLTSTFTNDHFVHLADAQQVRFGDWPTRDFIDIGRPLTVLVSAAGQWSLGDTLFADAVVVSAGFGLAAALTAVIVFSVTGSSMLAVAAVLMETAAFPRTYAYPKLLGTAVGLWLIVHYLRQPGIGRQALLAGGVVLAFLFRHDLGPGVGAGGLLAVVIAYPGEPARMRWRRAIVFAVMVLAFLAPYLAYVELNG